MIHPYQIFLELSDIEHRRTKVARPRTNGFVERFNRTVLDEFFREAFREKFYPSVEELQKDLDQWLHRYNYERPHPGYRNMGRKPIETIEAGKIIKKKGDDQRGGLDIPSGENLTVREVPNFYGSFDFLVH